MDKHVGIRLNIEKPRWAGINSTGPIRGAGRSLEVRRQLNSFSDSSGYLISSFAQIKSSACLPLSLIAARVDPHRPAGFNPLITAILKLATGWKTTSSGSDFLIASEENQRRKIRAQLRLPLDLWVVITDRTGSEYINKQKAIS